MYTLQEGRLPALWADFQGLLTLGPQQRVERLAPAQVRQLYRWVNGLEYTDSHGRPWTFTAIPLTETYPDGTTKLWAWVTDLEVNRATAIAVATPGGRQRWPIEHQGFNTQKHSDLNLEQAYSHGPQGAAYYYLLPIAHLLLQLLEKGSLLRQLAATQGKRSAVALFGSLKNRAYRLLESVRHLHWPAAAYDPTAAARIQIRLDSG